MPVEKNNKVIIEYEGRFNDSKGEIFDSSEGKPPLTFIAGVGMVVPGFDNAVIGMEKEQEKEIKLNPEQAYGERREELKQKIPRSALPQDQKPEPGMMIIMANPQGQQIPAKITEVDDKEITIDINHPLAGKTLYFKIKVKDYQEFNPEDLAKQNQDCSCGCAEEEPCKTGEEDCKCKSQEPKKDEPSIEDIAEGK